MEKIVQDALFDISPYQREPEQSQQSAHEGVGYQPSGDEAVEQLPLLTIKLDGRLVQTFLHWTNLTPKQLNYVRIQKARRVASKQLTRLTNFKPNL